MDGTRPTLIYDGDCGFCTTLARWVSRRWGSVDPPVARPWQQLSVQTLTEARLSADDVARSAWWIDGDRVEEGSRAVGRALEATRGPWAVVGRTLLVPPLSWVAPLGYRLVARYRSRLPGGTPACRV